MHLGKWVRLAVSVLAFIGVWWMTSGTFFEAAIVPSPVSVAGKLAEMIWSAELFAHLGASLGRIVLGYALGCVLGVGVGVATGAIRLARDLIEPPLEFCRNIPPVALIPLVVSIFGIGEVGKYFIISYAAGIAVLFNTAAGVLSTPQIRVRAALCLGARKRDVFLRVVLPSAWPHILTGLRLALGFSFMGVVAAEMLAADKGIGFLIMQSTNIIAPDEMFVGFFMLGSFGLITDQLFRMTIHKLMRRYMISMTHE